MSNSEITVGKKDVTRIEALVIVQQYRAEQEPPDEEILLPDAECQSCGTAWNHREKIMESRIFRKTPWGVYQRCPECNYPTLVPKS